MMVTTILSQKKKCWNCFLIALKLSTTHRKLWISVTLNLNTVITVCQKSISQKNMAMIILNILKTRPGKALKRDIHIVIRGEQKQNQG